MTASQPIENDIDAGVPCPHCGSADFEVQQLVQSIQEVTGGNWGASTYDDEATYVLSVRCRGCRRQLFNRTPEVEAAIEAALA